MAGDDRSRAAGSGVESNTEACRSAIRPDLSSIGSEFVLRVFGRDPTLDRVAASRNRGLRGDADLGIAQPIPFGDAYLCLHQVAAGDALRHRVLDLNARVYLDEVEAFVVDEEFNRSRVLIARLRRDPECCLIELFTKCISDGNGGCDLDDFLMTALHGTITFEKMNRAPVAVGQNLNFDVLRPLDELFAVEVASPERSFGFASSSRERFLDLVLGANDAHPATATAERGFEDDGQADFISKGFDVFRRRDRAVSPGDNRYVGLDSQIP